MAHPYFHAESSARKWGGVPEDYQKLHDWFDASKEQMADFRHRALRHHAQGCFEAERVFGTTIRNSAGKEIPTRLLAEQHVREDLGFIPELSNWLTNIQPKAWMMRGNPLENNETTTPSDHELQGDSPCTKTSLIA